MSRQLRAVLRVVLWPPSNLWKAIRGKLDVAPPKR